MLLRLQILLSVILLTVTSMASMVSTVNAQPLVEHVPGDAILYVGWQGADHLGGGYEASHLKGLMDEPQVKAYIKQIKAELQAMSQAQTDKGLKSLAAMDEMLPLIINHPAALYLSGEPVDVVVLLKPDAKDRPTLLEKLKALPSHQNNQSVITQEGDLIVIKSRKHHGQIADQVADQVADQIADKVADQLADNVAKQPAKNGKPLAQNLSTQAAFKEAMSQSNADAPVVFYLNVAAIWPLVQEQAKTDKQKHEVQQMVNLINAAGVDGVTSIVATTHFDKKDIVTNVDVYTPKPRQGMLALLDEQKLTEKQLAVVPATATNVQAVSLDPAKFLQALRQTVDTGMPEQAGMVDQVLMMGSMVSGVNLQENFIHAMGPTWVMYIDPALGSNLLGQGFGVVGELKDAKMMKQSLELFKAAALKQMAQYQEQHETMLPVTFQTIEYQGLEVHTCYVTLVGISWTIVDDKIFVAMSPQALVQVVKNTSDTANSITRVPAFKQMMQRLEGSGASMLSYVNLPEVAPQGYGLLMFLNQMMQMGIASEAHVMKPMVLPGLDVLLRHLSSSGSAVRADGSGIHMRYITPLPGAEILASQPNAMMMSSMVGVMLPALGSARKTARQMQSSTQARGIGAGCVLFLQGSKTPPDIAQLVLENYFTAEYAISPTSGKHVPANFNSMTADEKRQWLRQNASYIVVTKGMVDNTDTNMIMVFERVQDSGPSGDIAVCWADNHVTREQVEKVQQVLLKQTGVSMERLIQMQENGER